MKIITTHLSADFDAYASAVCALRLYPDHVVLFPGSLEATVRRFKAATALPFPEVKLREARRETIEHTVVVDTSSRRRLGEAWKIIESSAAPVTLIDHHGDHGQQVDPADNAHDVGDLSATTKIVRPVGATCTIISSLLREQGLAPSSEEASLLLMGIYEDTGGLSYGDTTAEDLRESARLLDAGGSLEWVRRWVVKTLEPEQLALLNRIVAGTEEIKIHGIPVAISLIEVETYHEEAAYVVHRWTETFQLPVAVAMLVRPPHVNLIIRSRLSDVNAGEIAQLFGGGGHATAAAARVAGQMPMEIRETMLEFLDACLPPPPRAGDVAVRKIFSVPTETTVEATKSMLNQLRVNALPVQEKESGELVGTVTRQILDRSLSHDMGQRPVRSIMQPGVPLVSADTSLDEVRDIFFTSPHRFVVVTEEDRPVGLITRMDLFRRLFERQSSTGAGLDHRMAGTHPARQDVSRTLRTRPPEWVIHLLDAVSAVADEQKERVYLVGGMVRDLLLERTSEDIDLVVEGDGIAFANRLADHLDAHIHCHEPFKTAVIVLKDGHKVDIASARTEFYRTPAALPEVATSLIRQDLYRRDFTINTLAVTLHGDTHGQLIDFFAGRKDLASKEIRVLHSLSFIDDPTRAIRAVRYARRLGFKISPDTRHLIKTAVSEGVFDRLSGQRLRRELEYLFNEGHATPSLALLAELELLKAISPGLLWSEELWSLLLEVEAQLAWFRLEGIGPEPEPWLLYLGALTTAGGPDAAIQLAERLQLVGSIRDRLTSLWQRTEDLCSIAESDALRSIMVDAVESHTNEALLVAMARLALGPRRRLAEAAELGARTPNPVSGREILAAGAPPGPMIGQALKQARAAVIDGDLTAEEAFDLALRVASTGSAS